MDDDDEPAHVIIGDDIPKTPPPSSDPSAFEQLHPSIDQLPPFVSEQRIFCKDKGTLYEAVIRQSRYGIAAARTKKLTTNHTGSSRLQQQQLPQEQPQWSYLVHFLGWNTRYDKWVKQEDILPDTEEHRSTFRQQQLLQQQQLQLTAAAAAAAATSDTNMLSTSTSSSSPMIAITMNSKSPAKRKASDLSSSVKKQRKECSTTGGLTSTADYCELPFTLQSVLVEEWEHITRTNHFDPPSAHNNNDGNGIISSSSSSFGWRPLRNVHHLPASVTIRQVLQHFVKLQSNITIPAKQQQQTTRPEEGSAPEPIIQQEDEEQQQRQQQQQQLLQQQHRRLVKDFVQDLLTLIEEALPVCLLYPQERPQWESLKANENVSSVCDVYGAEYLLRLVVRLPILMPTVKKDVGQLITELVVMLQKNRNTCFKGNYREPQPEEFLESERFDGMPESPHRIDDDTATATAPPQRL